jgi:hypothetical protein
MLKFKSSESEALGYWQPVRGGAWQADPNELALARIVSRDGKGTTVRPDFTFGTLNHKQFFVHFLIHGRSSSSSSKLRFRDDCI